MKLALASAALVALGLAVPNAAHAQGVPQGTYLRTCSDVEYGGDTLAAVCRGRAGSGERRTVLENVSRCVGDISNNNGNLACAYGNGRPQPRALVSPPVSEPRDGSPGYGERREPRGYGERREYYGERREYERREYCERLHRNAEELRYRMEREFNPLERARLDGQLRAVREQEERCWR